MVCGYFEFIVAIACIRMHKGSGTNTPQGGTLYSPHALRGILFNPHALKGALYSARALRV
jgi:hypothetical protein